MSTPLPRKNEDVPTTPSNPKGVNRYTPIALTPNNEKVRMSQNFFKTYMATEEFFLHPSMIPYTLPIILNKNNQMVLMIPHVHHNKIDARVCYEIVNNMLDNICKVIPKNKSKFGDNMVFFSIHWNMIRTCMYVLNLITMRRYRFPCLEIIVSQ